MDEKTEEEFSNFMMKVTDVSNIVRKMNSKDKKIQEIGDYEAKRFLGETDVEEEIEDVEKVEVKVKCDRTVLNKKALHKKEIEDNGATMSQEAFMEEMSRDSDRRYNDRLVRTEKMETVKKQATKAFRRGDYEKALCLYSKAIDLIRDSCLLYNNRALTYINLKFYDKAIPDLNLALRINEDGVRSWLLLAKANFCLKNYLEYHRAIKEARERNPEHEGLINDFIDNLKRDFGDGSN